jgi:MerR family mercuric resistance operon transcriptional regulator
MGYRIGELASKAGVHVETVRYYQRRGLMRVPPRPYGSTRSYSEDDLARLVFIRKAQSLGFSLQEIEQLLTLADGRCRDVAGLASTKRDEVRKKITDLERLESTLTKLLATCEAQGHSGPCPLIETLADSPAT